MSSRGGCRPGAGRRKKPPVLVKKKTAESILSEVDEAALWHELLRSEDQRIVLASLKYLTDRRDGLPPQSIAVKDTTEPARKTLPREYLSAVKLALGFTGELKPLVTIQEETGPRLRALPD